VTSRLGPSSGLLVHLLIRRRLHSRIRVRKRLGRRSGFGQGTQQCEASSHMCYHMVMARREVLVQLDDDLVARLDRLAADRGTNRSELLRRGALAVLEAEDLRQADDELQAAYRQTPQDPALVESAARLAAQTASGW